VDGLLVSLQITWESNVMTRRKNSSEERRSY
jgi:hypothetical protein